MPRGKIEYKGPWGGVNTGVPATYLQGNEFPLINNVAIINNALCSRPKFVYLGTAKGNIATEGSIIPLFNNVIPNIAAGPLFQAILWGATPGINGIWSIIANTGVLDVQTHPMAFLYPQTVYYPIPFGSSTYISGGIGITSITYGAGGTVVYTDITTAYGAVYGITLADHILYGYAYLYNGAAGTKNQLFWSGSNNPTVFNPATDSTAGNQSLQIVNINGMINIGYSGYVTHPAGIIQITPTGNATAPFNIQDIKYSRGGYFGNAYAYSLASDGTMAFYVGFDDIMMITPYGLQAIGGKSKYAIYNDIKTINAGSWSSDPALVSSNISGSVLSTLGQPYPYPCYVLSINTLSNSSTIWWVYSIQEDKWTKFTFADNLTQPIDSSFGGLTNSPLPFCVVVNSNNTQTGYLDVGSGGVFNTETTNEIDFRVEDQDGKFFQCARIRVTYRDLGVCPVTFSLYNVNEDGTYNNPAVQKTINLGTNAADGQIKQVYTDFVATGLFTQLKITRAANAGACSIIKVQLLEEGADNLEVV